MIYKFNKDSLKYEGVFLKLSVFVVIAIVFTSLTSYVVGHYRGYYDYEHAVVTPEERMMVIQENDKFSKEKFKIYLNK
jgi:hypothetical protein